MTSLYRILIFLLICFTGIGNSLAQCTVTITPSGSTTICTGSSVTLVASGATTYSWSPGGATTSTITVSPNTTTTYTVTGTGACGTGTGTVTVNLLNVTAGADVLVCIGNPINLTSTVSGNGSNTVAYAWTGPNGYSSTSSSPTIANSTIAMSGNYTVTATVGGCQRQDVVNVQVAEPEIETLSGVVIENFIECNVTSTTFMFDLSNQSYQSSILNYVINWGDNTSGTFTTTSNPISHTYVIGSYTMSIQMNLTNGCTATQTYPVFVGNSPSPATMALFVNQATGCIPHTTQYTFNVPSTNADGTTYVVSWGDGTLDETYVHPVSVSTLTHIYNISSCGQNVTLNNITYYNVYQPTVVTQNPCSTPQPSGSGLINIGADPTASFTPSNNNISPINHCIGLPLQLNNTSNFGLTIPTANGATCLNTSPFYWTITPSTAGLWTATGLGSNNGDLNNTNNWTLGSMTPTVAFNAPGTYTITIRVKNPLPCGESSFSQTFCIQAPPVPEFIATPLTGCAPLVVNFTDASSPPPVCGEEQRNWTVSQISSTCVADSANNFVFISGTNATSIDPVIRFNNQGIYEVTLSITNVCGTFTTDPTEITVIRKPEVSITVPSSICLGETISPTSIVQDCGDPSITYNWTFSGGTPATSTQANPTSISYSSGGSETVSLTVQNSCGTATANANIFINTPAAADAGADQSVCINSGNVPLNGVPGGGSWSGSTFISSSGLFTPSVVDEYELIYTVGSGNCLGHDTTLMTVEPLPNVTVTPSAAACMGQDMNLTAGGADTYVWSPSAELSAAIGTTVTASPLSTTIYTVTGTNSTTGCEASADVTVTINPLPIVNAGSNITLCDQPIPYTLTGYSPSGGIWSGSGVTSSGVFTPSVVGDFTLTYSFTNTTTSCSNSNTMIVTVVAPQVANAGTGFSICLDAPSVTLTGYTPTPGGTWSGTNVTSAGVFTPSTVGNNFVLTYSFGSGTCLSTDTILVTVNPLPVVAVNSSTICAGQTATLTASGTNTYSWSPNTNLSATTGTSVTASPTSTIPYTVTGTNTTTGCANTATSTVTVNQLPVVDAGASIILCNQPIENTLTGYSPTTDGTGIWTGTGVTSGGVFTPNGTGNFVLTYTFTNSNSCVNSDTMIVTVNNPVIANAGTGFGICMNAPSVTLAGYTPTTGGTWSGTNVTPAGVFTPSTVGNNFILTYSVGGGTCLSTDTILVTVNPLPTVSVSSATTCYGVPVSLTASGNSNTYDWSPSTGLSATTGATVTATNPTANSTYIVTGTITVTGCSNTAPSIITVNQLPVVDAGASIILCNQPIENTLTGYSPTTDGTGIWTGSNVTSAGVFTPNGVGSFILTYTFTDLNSCVNSDTMIVTVNNPVIANAGTGFGICMNAPSVTLTGYTPTPGGTWSGTNVTSAGVFTPSTVGNNFVLTYSFGGGTCLSTDTILVTVNPLPVVAVNSSTICAGQTATLTASGTNTYSWSPNTNLSATTGTSVTASPTSTIPYTVTGTNTTTGCANTATSTVTVNQLPVVDAGASIILCNQPIENTLTGYSPTTDGTGIWTGTGVTSGGVFTPNGTGNFVLTYTFTNSNSCVNSDTMIVTVNNPVIANAGTGFGICMNAPSVTLAGYTPTTGGTWSGTNVTPAGVFTPSTVGNNFVLTYSFGSGTCLSTDTILVTVNPLPPITITPSGELCIGEAMDLTASGADTYDWSPSTGLSATSGTTVTASPDSTTTYTISGTNSTTGCQAISDVTITVNPLPAVDAEPNQTFCNQPIPVTLTGYSPLGGNWSGNGVTANGIFTPSQAGLGSINLIYSFTDSNGCISSDTIAATILEPEQALAGPDTSICQSSTPVILVGSPTSGLWSGSILVSANGEFTPSLPGEYTLTYSYGIGSCLTIDERLITVDALPEVSVESDFDICVSEEPLELTGTPANGLWSGTGVTNQNSGEFDPFVAGVGNHVITYQFTSTTTGCLNLDSLVISVNPLPNVNFDSIPISCLDEPVLFSNTSTGGINFEWVFGDGTTSNGENPEHIYGDTGTFEITLIASSEFGCIDSISRLITVTIPPVADFQMSDSAGCGPLNVLITNTSSASFSTYSWDFGNGTTSNTQNPDTVVYPTGEIGDSTYYVTLTVSNNCGISTYMDSVVVYHIPEALLGLDQNSGCSPLAIAFANISTGFSNSYSWDFGDGTTSVLSYPGPHVFTTGTADTTYFITLIASNICGSDTAIDSVLVQPNTITSFFNTNPTSGCSPLLVTFTNYSTLGSVYDWDFGDGNHSSQYHTNHLYTTGANDTTYTVTLIVNNGCSYDTMSNTVDVFHQPDLSFTVSEDTVCSGQIISFTNTSLGLSNTYWDFDDGSYSTLDSPDHLYEEGGVYIASLTGTGSINGCIDTVVQKITVIETPEISISPLDTFGCQPFQLEFINSTLYADFYAWDFGDGNTSGFHDPLHTYGTNGTFYGALVASNNFGCVDSTDFIVTVYPQPLSDFTAVALGLCVMPDTVVFTNESEGAIGYVWDFGNGQTSTINNPIAIYQEANDYLISLVATSDKNCSDTSYFAYTNSVVPTADFVVNSMDPCKPVYSFTNLSDNAQSYFWDFGFGYTDTAENPIHSFSTFGESQVTLVINPDGLCSDSVSRIVVHNNGSPARVYIPNSFTPNNDGLNETFELKGFDDCGDYLLTIFDRWGKVLYVTADLSQYWDGTYNGKDLKVGTYVYVLQSLTFRKTGKITLIRN